MIRIGTAGWILIQLPPSLQFETRVARTFFGLLRDRHDGTVVCEPRHPTWFEPQVNALLIEHGIGRVAADPAVVDAARQPGGRIGQTKGTLAAVRYYRLHGSPRVYWSRYSPEQLQQWSDEIKTLSEAADVWCIFDNTAAGTAIENALQVKKAIASSA